MIIHSPPIPPKLAAQKEVSEGKVDHQNDKVEEFTHEKLPKVRVVVVQPQKGVIELVHVDLERGTEVGMRAEGAGTHLHKRHFLRKRWQSVNKLCHLLPKIADVSNMTGEANSTNTNRPIM